MKFTRFYLFVVAVFSVPSLFAQSDWQTKYNKEGIVIQTRGARTSEYKATVTVKADIKSCVALLQDIDIHPLFMNSIKSAEVIKIYNNKETLLYMVIDMPFPLGDRDLVSKAEFVHKPLEKKVIVNLKSMPKAYPAKDYERMQTADGFWLFEALNDQETKVTYQLKFDQSNAPNWIVNFFLLDNPKKIMKGFANFVQNPKYKETQIAWLN